ncbi:BNR-4 repeat-containing protein [Polaribacter glomeratus]|uniref:Uncharacterized protein n=1 Tax=Polaribacter glomeratus TaxID=102 RepID=A0A2S7WG26_9FLAO|nr:BNR-4 repeat-containing protein [Polaribacter glomeratus]PQJ76560.1 hypothetical protein BTO16_11715 [Polaribacter glomeratus]
MKKSITIKFLKIKSKKRIALFCFFLSLNAIVSAQVTLEKEVKISDFGLHFNGSKVDNDAANTGVDAPYDYVFGNIITPHGDCIKTYKEFVFMTWYKGGKENRHVMLTRYNTITGTLKTIEFPHQHSGFQNNWWLGESHNTIAVAISPLDGTIHLLYDMHAYGRTKPANGSLSNDYFRYSFSVKNAASASDEDFSLNQFVKNTNDGYKHLSLNRAENYAAFSELTYPQFFLNDSGDLFMYMREGGNNNGAYKFSKYTASTSSWSGFTHFNILNAKNRGEDYNWGLYGNMKYVNGKIRVGFQRRSSNNNDKYEYQNGIYYAYSDNQDGTGSWNNYRGDSFALPLVFADLVKVSEPGDLVATTAANQVYIVGGFDWTVTDNGDVHLISQVKDNENNETKQVHTYKKAGNPDFITTTDFSGAESIYTTGSDIYIIGLTNNGRVFVEKAEGGTNNFTRIYQANSGKYFNHGQVHIADGKLYYYLMEKKTGDAQPIYLQVIDLDIVQQPFNVSLSSPFNNQTFNTGETVALSANASTDTGVISKVDFKIDGSSFEEDTTAPYSVNWIPVTAGLYIIQAVAYNDKNESISSSEITVTIQNKDYTDLTGEIYRIKNLETGRYLDSEETAVIASISGVGADKEWEFVKAGDYFNINSTTNRGILRAAGSPVGAIINTSFAAPREDSDKQWTVIYEGDGIYRFEIRNAVRYLYNQTDNTIIHSENTDNRSKWQVELASTPLSLDDEKLELTSVKVYPNPANNRFTIALNGFNKAIIIVTDTLGKTIYRTATTLGKIKINNDGKFKPGVYFIKVIGDNQNTYVNKLIMR